MCSSDLVDRRDGQQTATSGGGNQLSSVYVTARDFKQNRSGRPGRGVPHAQTPHKFFVRCRAALLLPFVAFRPPPSACRSMARNKAKKKKDETTQKKRKSKKNKGKATQTHGGESKAGARRRRKLAAAAPCEVR